MSDIGSTLSKYTSASELSNLLESDKFGIISVKTFGAVGDGETDDTDAIQAAIDAVYDNGGGIVFIPSGTYLITSSVVIKENITLIGVGENSVIKVTTNINGLSVLGSYINVKNIKLDTYDKVSYTKSALYFGTGIQSHCRFEDIIIRGREATVCPVEVDDDFYTEYDSGKAIFFDKSVNQSSNYSMFVFFNNITTFGYGCALQMTVDPAAPWITGIRVTNSVFWRPAHCLNIGGGGFIDGCYFSLEMQCKYDTTDTYYGIFGGDNSVYDIFFWDVGGRKTFRITGTNRITDRCATFDFDNFGESRTNRYFDNPFTVGVHQFFNISARSGTSDIRTIIEGEQRILKVYHEGNDNSVIYLDNYPILLENFSEITISIVMKSDVGDSSAFNLIGNLRLIPNNNKNNSDSGLGLPCFFDGIYQITAVDEVAKTITTNVISASAIDPNSESILIWGDNILGNISNPYDYPYTISGHATPTISSYAEGVFTLDTLPAGMANVGSYVSIFGAQRAITWGTSASSACGSYTTYSFTRTKAELDSSGLGFKEKYGVLGFQIVKANAAISEYNMRIKNIKVQIIQP